MPLPTSQRRPYPPTWLTLLVVFAVFVYWAGNDPPPPKPVSARVVAQPVQPFPIQIGPSFAAKGFALTQQKAQSHTNQNSRQLRLQGVVRCLSAKAWLRLQLELQFLDQFDQPLASMSFDVWRHPTLVAGQGDELPFSLVRDYPDLAVQARLDIVGTNTRDDATQPSLANHSSPARKARYAMALSPSIAGTLISVAVFRGELALHRAEPTPPRRDKQRQKMRSVAGCEDLRFDLRQVNQTSKDRVSVWLAVDHCGQVPITSGRLRLSALDGAGRVLAQDTVILAQPEAPYLAGQGRRLLHARLETAGPVVDWSLDVVSLRRRSSPEPER